MGRIIQHKIPHFAMLSALAAVVVAIAALIGLQFFMITSDVFFGAIWGSMLFLGLGTVFGILSALLSSRRNSILNSAFDANDAAVLLTNGQGRLLFYNEKAQKFYAAETCRTVRDILHPRLENVGSLTLRMMALVQTQGRVVENSVHGNKTIRIVLSRFGARKYLWTISDPVSAQNRTTIYDTDIPIVKLDHAGKISSTNPAFEQIFGEKPTSLKTLTNGQVFQTGTVQNLHTMQGDMSYLSVENIRQDGLPEIALVPRPSLVKSEVPHTPNKSLFEDLPIAVLKVSLTGEIVGHNSMARTVLGTTLTDCSDINAMFFARGTNAKAWLTETLKKKLTHSTEFFHLFGRDEDTYFQLHLCQSADKDADYVFVAVTDVTEIKSLEAQFVQSQKMQAIGQLAGGIAHDFNNLLTAISGHCDLLLLRREEKDPDFPDLMQIHQNTNRAAALVGQLLAFSRKQNLRFEQVDLKNILSDLAHLLNRLVGERVELVLTNNDDLGLVRVDKRQLEQVLMNLVVNARDAVEGQGRVEIETSKLILTRPTERDTAVIPTGSYVVIKVSDEGVGIRPELLRKIFEPFFTTKGTGEGTGLGLSTVYGIVKQSDGFIFVESEMGRGTSFEILLPSVAGLSKISSPTKQVLPEMAHVTKGGTILLVEDEAPVRAFASRALKLKGFDVIEADCGESALTELENAPVAVDVFVTDVIMPGMDGPTWVNEALKIYPDTKVVFVSGYAEDSFDGKQALIENSVFLQKPFSLSALTETVSKVLD